MAEDLCRGRSACRSRGGWCSRETRQAVVQLVLLCVASCSWTLLLISLTLTTSASKPRHTRKVVADSGPQWTEGGADACEECLSRRGPPKSYWQVFERSLQQISAAIERLDQPLAPAALRAHLQATRTLLRRLAMVLHMPLISTPENQASRESSHEAILAAPGQVDGRLACPEQFMGPKAGYPRYHQGYMTINCSSLLLKTVLTAVLWDIDKEHLPNLLDDFKRVYPGLPILLVSNFKVKRFPDLQIESPKPSLVEGLRRILSHVKTPYVFLGTRLVEINKHSRLERLVWVAEWSGVWAVGGAGKGLDGRWRAGCLQVREGEGDLTYSRGYTTSLFECQLCHALETPMVMRTKALAKLNWPKTGVSSNLLFPRMFLDIHTGTKPHKHGAATCPDSMFYLSNVDPSWDEKYGRIHHEHELRQLATMWYSIAKHRQLSRVHLPSGVTLNYPCDYIPGSRQLQSFNFSPKPADKEVTAAWACERHELKIILNDFLKACTALKKKCYLLEPTLSVFLSGQSLQEVSSKTIELGVNDNKIVSLLHQEMKKSYYTTFRDSLTLVAEGRWWRVKLNTVVVIPDTKFMSIEIVDGLWIPAPFPSNGEWFINKNICDAPDIHVYDTSDEDHISQLTSSKCNHNKIHDMELRSP